MRKRNLAGVRTGGMVLALLVVSATAVFAAPVQFNYQGVLTDSTGNLVTSNNVDFRVSIYDASVGGTMLHQEIFAGQDLSGVPPGSNGVFNLAIGSITPLDPAILQLPDLYLQLEVDDQNDAVAGWEVFSTRQRILSSVFSMGTMDVRNNHYTVHPTAGHVAYSGLTGIQNAINDIPAAGTGYIELEPGVYSGAGGLLIPSGRTVILTGVGAEIQLSAGVIVAGDLVIQGLRRLEVTPAPVSGAIEVYFPGSADVRDATIFCENGWAVGGDSTIVVRDSTLITSSPLGSGVSVVHGFAPPIGTTTTLLLVKDSTILGGDIGINLGGPPGPGDGPGKAVIRDNQIGDITGPDALVPASVGILVNAISFPAYIRGNVIEMLATVGSAGIRLDDPDGDGLWGDAWVIDNQIGSWIGPAPFVGPDYGIDMLNSGRGVIADVQRNQVFGMTAAVFTNTTDTVVLAHNQLLALGGGGGPVFPVGAVAGSLHVDNYGADAPGLPVAELGNTDLYGPAFLTGPAVGAPLLPAAIPPSQGMLGGLGADGIVDSHN